MKTYPLPMVPGPVRVPKEILDIYQADFGSADLEPEFLELYNQTEKNLQELLNTSNRVVIQTGEGMLALWSALKSCLKEGDRVLSVASGIFGFGIADMAKMVGAEVQTIDIPYNQTIFNWNEIESALIEFRPKMITAVHCETPSGTLNPLCLLGELKRKYNIPLLYVDAVASIGGTEVLTDDWGVDLLLGGSQKCISAPPSMSFLAVSETAWEIIDQVGYQGYDALKQFRNAQKNFYFPYTPYWHGIAALNKGVELLLQEGLDKVYESHDRAAAFCRQEIASMGLNLYPAKSAIPSPTVTAVHVPDTISWENLDRRFRQEGLVVGGNYGLLSGKVFRLGHMGTQVDMTLLKEVMQVIKKVINNL